MSVKSRKTILVAEDDPDIAQMLKRVLALNYRVIHAPDGSNALAIGTSEPIDLLITDVMMPILDGFRLAHQLHLIPGKELIPVVFLTARDTPRDRITALRLRARHYIAKPFSNVDLLSKVNRLLAS